MSGHSRWSQIKRKKGKADVERGKLFSKILREITVAARNGGGDVKMNMRLKAAVESAKEANMPQDNIKRAVQKGTGELPGEAYEEITYEGYAPGGVAVLIHVLTDNRNRTGPEIRHSFEKFGGNMGSSGAVAWTNSPRGASGRRAARSGTACWRSSGSCTGREDGQGACDAGMTLRRRRVRSGPWLTRSKPS